ncbi:MAG: toprim domain-containing protein, partial [bacterium]|nr:toprim domain-containing protein [bacterium]
MTETQTRKLVTKKRKGNAPLPFTLSGVDAAHPYLTERGLRRATAAWFGIGYYAGRGLMKGRVVIPIHDEQGQLVAYCGRSVNGAEPRYRVPPGFRKSAVLFNYHRAVAAPQHSVVVVEGFFDCLRIHQAGFPGVVALMGAALSPEQEKLLVQGFRQVVLMLDGDVTGQKASRRVAEQLHSQCSVQQLALAPGTQPDQMS